MSNFFPARAIAKVERVSVHTIRYRAGREQWPSQWQGNRVRYMPPLRLRKLLGSIAPARPFCGEPRVLRELLRAAAVAACVLEMRRNAQCGIERALTTTASKYRHVFKFSPRALRRWVSLVSGGGLAALQERRAGIVGRKPMRLERILR
ncbi:MAG: hypothetical protein ACRED1_02570 [Limisphaerales bacterium]